MSLMLLRRDVASVNQVLTTMQQDHEQCYSLSLVFPSDIRISKSIRIKSVNYLSTFERSKDVLA